MKSCALPNFLTGIAVKYRDKYAVKILMKKSGPFLISSTKTWSIGLSESIFYVHMTSDLSNPMQNHISNNFSSECFAQKCVPLSQNSKKLKMNLFLVLLAVALRLLGSKILYKKFLRRKYGNDWVYNGNMWRLVRKKKHQVLLWLSSGDHFLNKNKQFKRDNNKFIRLCCNVCLLLKNHE